MFTYSVKDRRHRLLCRQRGVLRRVRRVRHHHPGASATPMWRCTFPVSTMYLNALAAAAAAYAAGGGRQRRGGGACVLHRRGTAVRAQGRLSRGGGVRRLRPPSRRAGGPAQRGAAPCPIKRLICAFQPHTYTRTAALFDDFVRGASPPRQGDLGGDLRRTGEKRAGHLLPGSGGPHSRRRVLLHAGCR